MNRSPTQMVEEQETQTGEDRSWGKVEEVERSCLKMVTQRQRLPTKTKEGVYAIPQTAEKPVVGSSRRMGL